MSKLSKAALERHRKALLQILDYLGVKLESMEDSLLHGEVDTSPDEVDEFGADGCSQEFQIGLIENEDNILRDVEDALARMASGEYGQCESCGGDIAPRRLEVRPYARYCLSCQQRAENGEFDDEQPPQPPASYTSSY